MAVNELNFAQTSAVIKEVAEQSSGQKVLAPVDTSSFTSVAQLALKSGYDNVMNAISQILSRTIYSSRAYKGEMLSLMGTVERWGNHVRKIAAIDQDPVDDLGQVLTDGQSIDQYVIRKPEVLQTNYYGFTTYEDYVTRFREQMDTAFSGPAEFSRFWGMIMQEITNKHTQWKEGMLKGVLNNFIGGKLLGDTGNVVHLVTEYNAASGANVTSTTVLQPANIRPFVQWMSARMALASDYLENRSELYHVNITGKALKRHTPKNRQKVFMLSKYSTLFRNMVETDLFNPQYLSKFAAVEEVRFWQNDQDPSSIDVTPVYLNANGSLTNSETAATTSVLVGAIIDDEAVMACPKVESLDVTPMNARGRYWNLWWNNQYRYWNDFTENGIVFLLD